MRAMPSPTCRTVPTSERSVSTSYCSIRCFRICVISSGRSFIDRVGTHGSPTSPLLPSSRCPIDSWAPAGPSPAPPNQQHAASSRSSRCHELSAKSLEPSAHARVDAHRARLQDDAADQFGIDLARRVDRAAGSVLDLFQNLLRFGVAQLVRGRQLDGQPAFSGGDEPLELLVDLAQLPGAVLFHREEHEVADELVRSAEYVLERLRLRGRVDLRVLEQRVQLGDVLDRGDEVAELLADLREALLLLRGLEER